MNPLERKIAEMALQAWRGEFDEIVKLAEAFGHKPYWNGNVLYIGKNIRSAIMRGTDPQTAFVALGFVFCGMLWPEICGEGYTHVKKVWSAEVKKCQK